MATAGLLWTVLHRWLGRFSSLIVFAVLSNLLLPGDFGLAALALVFTSVAVVVADVGFSTYLIQSQRRDALATSTAFWVGLALSALCGMVLFLAAPAIGSAFGEARLADVLRLASAVLPIAAIGSVPQALLRGELRFRAVAIISVGASVTSGVVAIGVALWGGGAYALVVQALVASAVVSIATVAVLRWRPRLSLSPALALDMARFGGQVLTTQLLLQVRGKGDDFLVGGLLGTEALGVYTVAKRIITITVELFAGVVTQLALPLFAAVKDEPERLRRVYLDCLRLSSVSLTPVMLLLAAVAPVLVPVLFGEQWTRSGELCSILALGATVTAIAYFDASFLYAIGRPGVELALVLLISVTHLTAAGLGALAGITAVAVAVTVRNIVFAPVRLAVLSRAGALRMRGLSRELLVVWIVAAAAAVAARLSVEASESAYTGLALAVTVFAFLYVLGLRLLAGTTMWHTSRLLPQRLSRSRFVRFLVGDGHA